MRGALSGVGFNIEWFEVIRGDGLSSMPVDVTTVARK